jgi:hypothetical protein
MVADTEHAKRDRAAQNFCWLQRCQLEEDEIDSRQTNRREGYNVVWQADRRSPYTTYTQVARAVTAATLLETRHLIYWQRTLQAGRCESIVHSTSKHCIREVTNTLLASYLC